MLILPATGRSSPRKSFPAVGGFVVARLGLDPCLAFAFPEGRAGLQIVHQKFRGLEGVLAMRRSGDDENDVVAGRKFADAMDDEARLQLPSLMRFRLYL